MNLTVPIDSVTIGVFSTVSGYTEAAIRAKIERGVWLQDQVWTRASDGRILISLSGYEAWVKGERWVVGRASEQSETAYRLIFGTKGSGAGSG